MTKEKQLKRNEDIFVANQRVLRDMYNKVQIGKTDLQNFTRWNSNQFEDTRNSIVFNEVSHGQ